MTLDDKTSHKDQFDKIEIYNLKIWNLRVQKKKKFAFKTVQIKFLAMHITNQKLCFYKFMIL